MIRLATFLALVGGYIAVIGLAGGPIIFRRTDALFVAGAVVACFFDATPSRASFPSTSFRAESVLGGTAMMGLALAMRFGMQMK